MIVQTHYPPATWYPSLKVIDLVMVSKELESKVIRSEYMIFEYMVASDHRPLIIKVDIHHLIHKDVTQKKELQKYFLKSKHKTNTRR